MRVGFIGLGNVGGKLSGSLLRNGVGTEGATAILDVAQSSPNLTTLCGFKPDQTEADFSHNGLGVGDAMFLAFDLKKNTVLVKLKYAAHALHTLSVATDNILTPISMAASGSTTSAPWARRSSPTHSNRTRRSRTWSAHLPNSNRFTSKFGSRQ